VNALPVELSGAPGDRGLDTGGQPRIDVHRQLAEPA
jgi:hypothetical protein